MVVCHLHYNKIKHVREAILGFFVVLARNCLTSMLDYIVMQIRKINREKGHYNTPKRLLPKYIKGTFLTKCTRK